MVRKNQAHARCAGVRATVARRAEREARSFAPVPAEEVEAPEHREQQPDPAEQRDKRDHRPDDHVRGRLVAHQGLGRPVVRVRVVVPRPARRGCPARPSEVGAQVAHRLGILDRLGTQSVLRRRAGEEVPVVTLELLMCDGLLSRQLECLRITVVAVGLEVLKGLLTRHVGTGSTELALHRLGRASQVVSGEVRTQIGAVAEDRAVLHQAVTEEDLLTLVDLIAGVDDLAGRIDDSLGDRGVGLIGPVSEQAEDEEPDQEDERDDLEPSLGDE